MHSLFVKSLNSVVAYALQLEQSQEAQFAHTLILKLYLHRTL